MYTLAATATVTLGAHAGFVATCFETITVALATLAPS